MAILSVFLSIFNHSALLNSPFNSLGSLGDDGSETDTDTESFAGAGYASGGGSSGSSSSRHNIWNVTHTILYRLVPVQPVAPTPTHVPVVGAHPIIDASTHLVHVSAGVMGHPAAASSVLTPPDSASPGHNLIPVVMAPNLGSPHTLALATPHFAVNPSPLSPPSAGEKDLLSF